MKFISVFIGSLSIMLCGAPNASAESFFDFARGEGVSVQEQNTIVQASNPSITVLSDASGSSFLNFAKMHTGDGITVTPSIAPSAPDTAPLPTRPINNTQSESQIDPLVHTGIDEAITIVSIEQSAKLQKVAQRESVLHTASTTSIETLLQGSVVESYDDESGAREMITIANEIQNIPAEPVLERLDDVPSVGFMSITQIIIMIILSLLLIVYITIALKKRSASAGAQVASVGMLIFMSVLGTPLFANATVTEVQSSGVADFQRMEGIFTGGIEDILRIDTHMPLGAAPLAIEPIALQPITAQVQSSITMLIIQSIQDIWARLMSHEIRFKKIEADIKTIKAQQVITPSHNQVLPSGNTLENLL